LAFNEKKKKKAKRKETTAVNFSMFKFEFFCYTI